MAELKKHGELDTITAIFEHYESSNPVESQFRGHLGASLIGKPCDREIWYIFRWAITSNFTGRLYRLFETGELEEARLVRNLRDVGVTVHDVDPNTKEQFRAIGLGGHFGGSFDGVALGLKEAPKSWHILEFKTASQWAFKSIKQNGVMTAKPEHYAQMMMYMGAAGLKNAFYLARNKNTDDLYSERIKFKKAVFDELVRKATRIISSNTPPARNESEKNCKYCRAKDLCIGRHEPYKKHLRHYRFAARNCRTCIYASAVYDDDPVKVISRKGYDHSQGGVWLCGNPDHDYELGFIEQMNGCASWEPLQGILPDDRIMEALANCRELQQLVIEPDDFTDMDKAIKINHKTGEIALVNWSFDNE